MGKYLITGILGHLGPHLANIYLENGHDVYGLIRKTNGLETDILDVVSPENFAKIKFVYGDIADLSSLDKIFRDTEFTGVAHLAAQSHPAISFQYPLATFQTNIIGTANIVECITRYQPNCRFHFCSSSEVYGQTIMEGSKIQEDAPMQASNPYSASKLASDAYISERFRNGFLKGFITRSFSHCAPRRGNNFSISSDAWRLAKIKLELQKDKVLKVGNLEAMRAVTDGRDIAYCYFLLMCDPRSDGQAYNVCSGLPRKMGWYTDKLIEISRLEGITKEIDSNLFRKIDIPFQDGCTDKLKQIVNWEPKIPIEQTLSDIYHYWLKKLS